jgi:hypothetical protein
MLARSMIMQEFENWPVKQSVETCSMVTQTSHQDNNVQVIATGCGRCHSLLHSWCHRKSHFSLIWADSKILSNTTF